MENDVHDRRAHDRIDSIEVTMQKHLKDHLRFESALEANTALTKTIADNTSELVALIKGAKVGGKILLWVTPVIASIAATWASVKVWFMK